MSSELNDIRKKIDAYIHGGLCEDQINGLGVEFAEQPVWLDDVQLEVGIKEIINTPVKRIAKKRKKSKPLPFWKWDITATAILIFVLGMQFIK